MEYQSQNFSVQNNTTSQDIVDNGTYKVRMHHAPTSGHGIMPGGCYGPPEVEIIISDPNVKVSLEQAFNIMLVGHNKVDFILNYGSEQMDVRANEVSLISQLDKDGNVVPVFKINKDGTFTDLRPKIAVCYGSPDHMLTNELTATADKTALTAKKG